MFIELTDHLRCPADHDEAFLVLLPDRVEHRDVKSGTLGCPVCGWGTAFSDGIVDFGGGRAASAPTALTPEAVKTFLGLSGPGGYVALVGTPASLVDMLASELRGVTLVLVNPPEGTLAEPPTSVVLSGRMPVKAASMRGVVLGQDFGSNEEWVRQAAAAVLPGLRIVVEGSPPVLPELEILAETEGLWVGRRSPDR